MTLAGDLGEKYDSVSVKSKAFSIFRKNGITTNIHGRVPYQGVYPGHHLSTAWKNRPDGDLKKKSFVLKSFNLFKVSSLSFGASSLGGVFKATDDSESANLVKRVLQQGINYIDTAPW